MSKLFNIKTIYIVLLSPGLNPFSVLANTTIDIQTNQGLITVQLEDEKAPITVANFLTYVDEGFYTDTVFHRVINNFLIQGGGLNAALEIQEVHDPIILESLAGLSNTRGTIAMARRNDPDSASAQFFINTVDNLGLDYQGITSPGYAVFGEVIEGMDVVDAISAQTTETVPVAAGVLRNVPVLPVVIEAVRLRIGQLAFVEMQETFSAGDTIVVSLEETMIRQSVTDLWAAVLTEEGDLFFVTEQGFSLVPSALKTEVSVDESQHPVFELTVPEGLTGRFTLFAIFNNTGDGIADLNQSLRSNIATKSIDLVQ